MTDLGARWPSLTTAERLAISARAGWRTHAGAPNFVAKRHAKSDWPTIPESSRHTLEQSERTAP